MILCIVECSSKTRSAILKLITEQPTLSSAVLLCIKRTCRSFIRCKGLVTHQVALLATADRQ